MQTSYWIKIPNKFPSQLQNETQWNYLRNSQRQKEFSKQFSNCRWNFKKNVFFFLFVSSTILLVLQSEIPKEISERVPTEDMSIFSLRNFQGNRTSKLPKKFPFLELFLKFSKKLTKEFQGDCPHRFWISFRKKN